MAARSAVRVVLEVGSKRVFASALDWPGLSRSGKDEALARELLERYAGRYRTVAERAGVGFPASPAFEVVERLPGDASTDFGAPGAIAAAEREPLTAAEARRLGSLLGACWDVFDRVVAGAPAELRKGPRGGGRDRDKVVAHVLEAEKSYARTAGWPRAPRDPDRPAVATWRADVIEAVRSSRSGEPARERGWPPRYAVRRAAWHALDHAWEIEDRSDS